MNDWNAIFNMYDIDHVVIFIELLSKKQVHAQKSSVQNVFTLAGSFLC